MTAVDSFRILMALFTLALATLLAIAGGIRLQKWWFMRRTRIFVEQQEREYVARLRSLSARSCQSGERDGHRRQLGARKDASN